MQSVVFQCPRTGLDVQGLVDESLIGPKTALVPIECPLCSRAHLIIPADLNLPGNNARKQE
jgi:hypothetical protein